MTSERSTSSLPAGRLEALGVSVHFNGVRAVDGIDLELARGEILGLIGPNGAGKTTLVNVLSGYQRPTSGMVRIDDHDVTRRSPSARARHGIVRTFQSVRLFHDLTVLENVELGGIGIGLGAREARRTAWALLERMGLSERAANEAASLPYGDERRVGIARALAARPQFLLLDEPAAGLNDTESEQLVPTLAAVRDEFECGVMVIEHDVALIMRLCDRVQVLDYGKTIAVGPPDVVKADPAVIAAYFGAEREASGA